MSPAASAASSAYDWTYTTPYAGSVVCAPPAAAAAAPAVPTWHAVDERIDRTLLLARDPILFFDELTLYESELDDNGTMSLTVKARVRPLRTACSVLLLWLRVCMSRLTRPLPLSMHRRCAGSRDAVVLVRAAALLAARGQRAAAVRHAPLSCNLPAAGRPMRPHPGLVPAGRRLRETRIFCKTAPGGAGGATLLRERSLREETFEALKERCEGAKTDALAVLLCVCAQL